MYDGKQYVGRKGSARISFELKERNLDVPVSRTHIYLALHANNDGNCSTPAINANIDKIKDTIAANPSSALLDLDHDPLVRVYGVDNNCRVLGFPIGICKRGYLASAPARIQLQMQKQVVSSVLHQVDATKSQFDKHGSLISMLASTGGSNTTCGASPSNVCVLSLYYL